MKKSVYIFMLAAVAMLLVACSEKKENAVQKKQTSEKKHVNGIARQTLNNMLEQMQEDNNETSENSAVDEEPDEWN